MRLLPITMRLASLAALLLATAPAATLAQDSARPNLIFIMADDLGYGDLGCYGQEQIRTPHLDRMAAEGMRLTDYYAGSTVCAPSRSVLMTGQHLGHTWVRGNGGPDVTTLPDEEITVAEILQPAGYTCGVIGKWGLGDLPEGEGHPLRQGFDFWFGYLDQTRAHFFYPDYLWRNYEKVLLPENADGARETYSHDLMTEEALGFVQDNRDGPFFLYLAYTIPHAELLVPEDSLAEYRGQFKEEPYVGRHYASQPTPNAALAAMITRMDRDIGRLLQLLQNLGIDENTLVIFTSDNGPAAAGGRDPHYFDSNGPLRGIKRDLYEGGIRSPFIARWPGVIAPGTVSEHICYGGDLMASAAELAGAPMPPDRDSLSFLPTLRGQPEGQAQHDYLYWEFYKRGGIQAARGGRWKAVRQPMFTGPIELYDLDNDISEQHDLAARYPERAQSMARIMSEAHQPHPNWSPQP